MESVRERIERIEAESLAPGAARSSQSRGRRVDEQPHPVRTAFMRDRDRVLHCKAFRRLAHKTQVFVAPEGDHHRVRLTHTLEVAQIARTIARALRLNEDLAEAICLGHDLGHTPFGHLGEEALSEFLGRPFRHNEQSLRVVDELEGAGIEDPLGRGLNLTWEVRDGILNHTWSMPAPGTLEAGIARYADRIAYLSHDIDDALRARVLEVGDLPPETNRVFGATPSSRIDVMVASVVESSMDQPKVGIADDVFEVMNLTREFMFARVYNRPELRDEQKRLKGVLSQLLEHFGAHPELFGAEGRSPEEIERRLVDYVAGMTDRFALRRHQLLFETGLPGSIPQTSY